MQFSGVIAQMCYGRTEGIAEYLDHLLLTELEKSNQLRIQTNGDMCQQN